MLIYTSGTTGKSKGVALSYRALADNTSSVTGLWRFAPEDRLVLALPLFHVHGLVLGVGRDARERPDAPPRAALRARARRPRVRRGRRDRLHGRPDDVRPPPRAPRRGASVRLRPAQGAPLHVRQRPAAGGRLRRVPREDRPRDPRALRHERDALHALEPVRRRTAAGHRRPRDAGLLREDRRRRGARGRRRGARRDRRAKRRDHERILGPRGRHGRVVPGGMVPHGRRRAARSGRVRHDRRPQVRRHHQERRIQDRGARDRGRPEAPPRREGCRRRRPRGPRLGAEGRCRDRPRPGRGSRRRLRGGRGVRGGPPRGLQEAARRHRAARAAPERPRQGAEAPPRRRVHPRGIRGSGKAPPG